MDCILGVRIAAESIKGKIELDIMSEKENVGLQILNTDE
jgi:hypothetical protein